MKTSLFNLSSALAYRATLTFSCLLLLSADSSSALRAQCSPTCITPGHSDNFITRWNTEGFGNIFINTVGSGFNYNLYWYVISNPLICGFQCGLTGDYTIPVGLTDELVQVEISGTFPRMSTSLSLGYPSGRLGQLREVTQWGSIAWGTMEDMFLGSYFMDVTATDAPNLSGVLSMAGMFYGCSSLVGNNSFNLWNTANVTTMSQMFAYASSFNQPIGS